MRTVKPPSSSRRVWRFRFVAVGPILNALLVPYIGHRIENGIAGCGS